MNLSEGMLLTQSDDLDDRLDRARKANAADTIDELRAFAKSDGWSDEELAEAIRTRFPEHDNKSSTASTTVTAHSVNPLTPSNTAGFFEQYLNHLRAQNWGESTVESVKDSVEETYLRIQTKNPTVESQERAGYGLVVGRIQSGKTAHMLGLSFRAIDTTLSHTEQRPYDTIIILSGLLEDLRKQTYNRLKKSDIDGIIYLPQGSDFSEKNDAAKDELLGALEQDQPLVLVIKKNHTVLESLCEYLNDDELNSYLQDRRVLVIDDECDHASIDSTHSESEKTSDATAITATNRAVRSLIKILEVSRRVPWYIGYTATPYSNLLMNPQPDYVAINQYGPSLFPRDMIHCLPKPDGHSDNEYFFSKKGEDNIVQYESPEPDSSNERKHLKELVHLHVLAKLIREQRLKVKHSENEWKKPDLEKIKQSTMIHTEVETDQHLRVADLVSTIKDELSQTKDTTLFVELDHLVLKRYPDFLSQYTERKTAIVTSKYLGLKDYYTGITVVKLNAEKDDGDSEFTYPKALNYKENEGFSHIVVGGQKLSRGLTIESLVLVWFDRAPKTPNYDTLLQMARWCGYRNEFRPLMRLFMGSDTILYFQLIADVESRLRAGLLQFTKDTDPLAVVQWIREYKGMRISARASPDVEPNPNPSDEKFLDAEFHIKHLHERDDTNDLKKIQFSLYEKTDDIYDLYDDDFEASQINNEYQIVESEWAQIKGLIELYETSYKKNNLSKRFLRNLLVEVGESEDLSDRWNIAIYRPSMGEEYDQKFILSNLGYKVPPENHLKIPKNADKIDYPIGINEREYPLLVIYLENPKQKTSGVPIYFDNGYPIVMLSFYLPEGKISRKFLEFARPGISGITLKKEGSALKEEEE